MPLELWVLEPPPTPRNRLTCGIRLFWAFPQLVALIVVNIIVFFALIGAWFMALFTGRVEGALREFLVGALRWNIRVSAYFYFLTDAYPPYSLDEDASYPVRLAVPPGSELNRVAVLLRIFIAIPGWIVVSVLGAGLGVVAVGSWFMLLVTGELPTPLFEATRAVVRYQERFYGYFAMLTPEYSWGPLGDEAPPTEQNPWAIRLSDTGRIAMYVVIVLGVIIDVVNSSLRGHP